VKILFVIDSLTFGGTERQLVELINGLDRHRYEVHLVSLDNVAEGYTDLLTARGIRIRYFCRGHKYDIRPGFSISRYIRENQIELVHAFLNMGVLFGLIAAKLSGRPVVCSAIRDAKDQNLKVKVSKKIVAHLADIFVANSRAGFTNRFRNMKPHFRVVHNGLDFSRFEETKDARAVQELKKDLHLHGLKRIVGMVASLSERKDHETLLDAAPMVLQAYPETCFLLVGDGVKRKTLMEKAKQLGLENNVLFLGFRKDVDHIYDILDILVLLSNTDAHLEGISNAIIEAMAAGVPVVASEGGGTNEIVKNDANGVLIAPKNAQETAEAIVGLLGDKDKAQRLANTAKLFVREMFNLQRYVEEYESIYRELILDER